MPPAPQYTEQQRAILDAADYSVAVSAGAGCGKTFVLTQRFLGYLNSAVDQNDPLRGIVAITFTDRAAREMRHRVRTACQARLIDCTAEEAPLWLRLLRSLDTARISTIHSFCSNLLRRFAVEAGLDPAFDLLDATFGDAFTRRAVRDGLCRLLENSDPDATQLALRFEFERTCLLLEGLLDGARMAGPASLENATPESLCELWQKCWSSEIVPQLFHEFWSSPTSQKVLQLLRDHEPSHPVMLQRRATLLEMLSTVPATDAAGALKTIRENAGVQGGGTKKSWSDESVYDEIKNALSKLREEIDKLNKTLAQAAGDPRDAAEVALAAHRVIQSIAEQYDQQKRDAGQLDFDDLLTLARNLLRDNAAVRQRAAAGLELLMVDEFQDTDPVQAELVRYLCGEQLTQGMLFLVGDAKQSIYRFRGADPGVFARLREDLPERGRLPLTTNFRSQPAILNFVNFLFEPEMPDYEPLVPGDPVQHSPTPSIEFLFASTESDDKAEDKAEPRRRREALWIANRITQLLADETPRVYDSKRKQLRRTEPGDIAILFRTLSNVHLYEHALQDRGLDYYLAGGRAFFAQQEIHDVSHLFRWLDDPADELSLAGVLRSPLFGLNDDSLFLLKPQRTTSLADGLANPPKQLDETQREQACRAWRILSELRTKKDLLPLGELLSLAIERTAYDAALFCEHLGPRKLANLRKLVRLARSFDDSGSLSLGEFVDKLRDAVREEAKEELAVTHPEVSGVLRLMTIHQSKGLEFPVVILADMDWKSPGGRSTPRYHPRLGPLFSMPDEGDDDDKPTHLGQMIHRQQEAVEEEAENLRLLYVATTRARDHLILSAGLDRKRTPHSGWMKLLARRFHLDSGLPHVDTYFGSASGRSRKPQEMPEVFPHLSEPAASEKGKKHRTDHAPLRQFRELIETATPEPLPPLVRRIASNLANRVEFTVSELTRADQVAAPARRRKAKDKPQDAPPPEPSDYAALVGSATHAVLERIDFSDAAALSPESLADEVDRALQSLHGETDENLRRRITGKLHSFVSSPLRGSLATAKRLCREVEFRLRWETPGIGETAEIIGTIDCLYQSSDDAWHLIDYKSVDDAGRGDAELVGQYELQLAAYALAVERLFGSPPRSATLVRLGPPIQSIPLSVTKDALNAASRRIDRAIQSLRAGT